MTTATETAWRLRPVNAHAAPRLTLDALPANAQLLGWAPDGSRLAFANNESVRLVSIPGGAQTTIAVPRPGHVLAWRPDGKAFAIEVRTPEDHAAAVREFDVETGVPLRNLPVAQPKHAVRRIAYLDGGAVLAVYVEPDRSYSDPETGCTWGEIDLDAPAYGEATTTFFGPQGETLFAKKRYGFEAIAPDGSGLLRMKAFRDLHFWAGDKRISFRNPFRFRSAHACELRRLTLQEGGATESVVARFESDVKIHASHPGGTVSLIECKEDIRESTLLELDWTTGDSGRRVALHAVPTSAAPRDRVTCLPKTVVPEKGVQVCALAFHEGGLYVDQSAVRHYWLALEDNRIYDLGELPGDPYTAQLSLNGQYLAIKNAPTTWRIHETAALFP